MMSSPRSPRRDRSLSHLGITLLRALEPLRASFEMLVPVTLETVILETVILETVILEAVILGMADAGMVGVGITTDVRMIGVTVDHVTYQAPPMIWPPRLTFRLKTQRSPGCSVTGR